MAEAQHSASSTPEAQTEREFTVLIRPYALGFWEYFGTRAQLEAEGVIPPGTKWPEGAQDNRWDAGRFRYWLRRSRPDGLKGPMKLWTSGDWWCLRCNILDGPDRATRSILEKKAELVAELYRHSAAGQRERDAQWNLYWKACDDKAFQSFKAQIPALIPPPRRGRKPSQPQA